MIQALLWDLDGTIASSHAGVIGCIQYALEKAGLPVPPAEQLLWCIGPPLHVSLGKLGQGYDPAELVRLYRERYAEKGVFEHAVYPGIPEVLKSLRGLRHFVATSKAEVFARQIVSHFGLTSCFEQIYGSELNGDRADKGDLLAYLLELEGLAPRNVLMIGDREFDVLGAKKVGSACAGVLWGYGSREELERAGAKFLVSAPSELMQIVAPR